MQQLYNYENHPSLHESNQSLCAKGTSPIQLTGKPKEIDTTTL